MNLMIHESISHESMSQRSIFLFFSLFFSFFTFFYFFSDLINFVTNIYGEFQSVKNMTIMSICLKSVEFTQPFDYYFQLSDACF